MSQAASYREHVRHRTERRRVETLGSHLLHLDGVAPLLRKVRLHLGLEASFIAEVVDGQHIVRYVDGRGEQFGLSVGDVAGSDDSYCQRMLAGLMPNLIKDTHAHLSTRDLAASKESDVRCYVGVPILLSDGRVFGTLCAIGRQRGTELDERDLGFVRLVAELISDQMNPHTADSDEDCQRRRRTEDLLHDEAEPAIWLQPMVDLKTGDTVGFEALSRFARGDPEVIFSDAWICGLGEELEIRAVTRALSILDRLPLGTFLSVNVSPMVAIASDFAEALRQVDVSRLVIEVTEHETIKSYATIKSALKRFVCNGMRLAIDDVGTGHSSLIHIMELAPDILKLDRAFIHNVDIDPVRSSLTSALVTFAGVIDADIVAEGIETASEFDVLRHLGVATGQGYFVGRPRPAARLDFQAAV